MIVRTVDLERARTAAATELAGVERLGASSPLDARGSNVSGFPGREQLATITMLMLCGGSEIAAKRWGEQWKMGEQEAEAIAGPLLDVIEIEMGNLASDPYSRLYLALGMYALPRVAVSFFGGGAAPAKSDAKPLDIDKTGASN